MISLKIKSALDNGLTFRTISFDLQSILSLPFAGDNQLYYRRKLNVYNFTIFDSFENTGYVWNECNGKKGSAEICLIKYLTQLPESVSHITTYSDTCRGKNRNKNIFAINNLQHLETIDGEYMESGHSCLEADFVHATNERCRKHKKIYTTQEWALLFSTARIKPSPLTC